MIKNSFHRFIVALLNPSLRMENTLRCNLPSHIKTLFAI